METIALAGGRPQALSDAVAGALAVPAGLRWLLFS
jgi:hypothetical protein